MALNRYETEEAAQSRFARWNIEALFEEFVAELQQSGGQPLEPATLEAARLFSEFLKARLSPRQTSLSSPGSVLCPS